VVDDETRSFLRAQRVVRLATVSQDGRPHVVPVCFAIDGDVLYTAIDAKPKTQDIPRLTRIRNIAANPQVQVLADAYNDADWSRLRYVQLRGRARVLGGGEEHARALALLRERYAQYRDGSPYAEGMAGNPVIAVDIERVVGWP
jgi:PPOX class probable F420-dependent enzyme